MMVRRVHYVAPGVSFCLPAADAPPPGHLCEIVLDINQFISSTNRINQTDTYAVPIAASMAPDHSTFTPRPAEQFHWSGRRARFLVVTFKIGRPVAVYILIWKGRPVSCYDKAAGCTSCGSRRRVQVNDCTNQLARQGALKGLNNGCYCQAVRVRLE